jgi:hypothetical protein
MWTKSSTPQGDFDQIAALGFRYAIVNPEAAPLDRLRAAGLKPILWLGNYDDINCFWRWSDSSVRSRIDAVKNHPLLANGGADVILFVADEPHSAASGGCASAPRDVRQRAQFAKSLLPNARTFITENRTEDFANLAKTTDVFGAIKYPCSTAKGCVISKIGETGKAVNAAGITEWWGVPQAADGSDGYYRAPTASEMQQIIDAWKAQHGIDGMLVYAWGDGCCGDSVGMRDFPWLWPVWQAQRF